MERKRLSINYLCLSKSLLNDCCRDFLCNVKIERESERTHIENFHAFSPIQLSCLVCVPFRVFNIKSFSCMFPSFCIHMTILSSVAKAMSMLRVLQKSPHIHSYTVSRRQSSKIKFFLSTICALSVCTFLYK